MPEKLNLKLNEALIEVKEVEKVKNLIHQK